MEDNRKSTVAQTDEDDLIITDERLIADQEARNGLLQFDEVERLVRQYAFARSFDLTPEIIKDLNQVAIAGVRRSAGQYRLVAIQITNTSHIPPPYEDVPRHMADMCMYVKSRWNASSDEVVDAIHLAAYLMWRLNWIHPFRDGNGRTSRAVSYLVLSIRLGRELPGDHTIADQIVDNKQPYYDALDAADEAWRNGSIDLSLMESLLSDLLVTQLSSIEASTEETQA